MGEIHGLLFWILITLAHSLILVRTGSASRSDDELTDCIHDLTYGICVTLFIASALVFGSM